MITKGQALWICIRIDNRELFFLQDKEDTGLEEEADRKRKSLE